MWHKAPRLPKHGTRSSRLGLGKWVQSLRSFSLPLQRRWSSASLSPKGLKAPFEERFKPDRPEDFPGGLHRQPARTRCVKDQARELIAWPYSPSDNKARSRFTCQRFNPTNHGDASNQRLPSQLCLSHWCPALSADDFLLRVKLGFGGATSRCAMLDVLASHPVSSQAPQNARMQPLCLCGKVATRLIAGGAFEKISPKNAMSSMPCRVPSSGGGPAKSKP